MHSNSFNLYQNASGQTLLTVTSRLDFAEEILYAKLYPRGQAASSDLVDKLCSCILTDFSETLSWTDDNPGWHMRAAHLGFNRTLSLETLGAALWKRQSPLAEALAEALEADPRCAKARLACRVDSLADIPPCEESVRKRLEASRAVAPVALQALLERDALRVRESLQPYGL